jgi:hypothetical protein
VATRTHKAAHRERATRETPGVLSDFHCHCVSYRFRFAKGSFNTRKFSRETGIAFGDKWSTALPPMSERSGYHVHFDGRMTDKIVEATVAYVDGQMKQESGSDDTPPQFAESFMSWLGGFVEESPHRANVWAHFDKPATAWRPKFNLPFKVTMSDREVIIDEVSLILPRNQFRATKARLGTSEDAVSAWVNSTQPVEFGQFEIAQQVALFDEAIKMFVEPRK